MFHVLERYPRDNLYSNNLLNCTQDMSENTSCPWYKYYAIVDILKMERKAQGYPKDILDF